jgi:hypothetical protein
LIRGSIAAELRSIQRKLPKFLEQQASYAGSMIQTEVKRLTPVGRTVDPVTGADLGPSGKLKASIKVKKVAIVPPDRFISGAESDLPYASHVEYGTRRHIIEPRTAKALRFWDAGQLAFARRVNHPGTQGHHMFSRGLQVAERRYQSVGNAKLQSFLTRA